MIRVPIRTLAIALLLTAGARADVLTVGGLAPDHATIQEAVDAAADGDVVLVRPGSYAGFSIFDKSLTVAARAPGVSISGMVRVHELAPHRRVSLIDLHVTGNGERALRLADCAGAVRVHGGSYQGTDFVPCWEPINDGVFASHCADLAFTAATLVGGHGASFCGHDNHANPGGPGGNGLLAIDCKVALYDCVLIGGRGAAATFDGGKDGGRGGSGALVQRATSYLLASGSSFAGGNGGNGGNEHWTCATFGGGWGGSGGNGVWLDGSAGPGVLGADLIELAVAATGTGGSGGIGICGPNGPNGAPGQPLRVDGSVSAGQHPWSARKLELAGTWTAGQPANATFHGEPGDVVFLLRSPKTAFLPDLPKKGVLLLGGVPQLQQVGTIGATGVLTRALPIPTAAPGFEGAALQLQAWMASPSDGLHFTGAAPVVVLHPSF